MKQTVIEQLIEKGYTLTTDPAVLKAKALMPLYKQAYWAKDRPLEMVEKSLEHSRGYGIVYEDRLVAFLRLITDEATFAYLCDVIVDEVHRGLGLSKWMLHEALEVDHMVTLRRIALITRDAHGVYEPFGFKASDHPDRYMEIFRG